MPSDAVLLLLAGIGAGLTGSIAGLASLVSYPALIATGLSPLAANVTNTTSMLANAVGAALGSRTELAGQWRRLRVLMGLSALGGLAGAGLLLVSDESTFEAIVPWLVGLGAVLLLARNPVRAWAERRRLAALAADPGRVAPGPEANRPLVAAVGVYGGYFGAGVGIILLAVLAMRTDEPLAVTNAIKNVASGTANVVAAVAYAFLAPVHWPSVLALGAGALVGSLMGPRLVRMTPEAPLRWAIGLSGLGLGVWLAVT
ncbi:sulfite exporter TauE/SafE family protein [Nocardioides sp. BYT-33-1]|uniref:sulfite exporter TauE/SafE family protein n=1 Tax=Nocardioides sp. BYT-33-1 TaxID=3416952 RepID=UPI003F539803